MRNGSETKAHGSIRTMKSGGAAGVVLGLAAVGLAMGTNTTYADQVEVPNQPKVEDKVGEVKESDITNDTPTGNPATNLNAPAGTLSDAQKSELDNADNVTGNISVKVNHDELNKAVQEAKDQGVKVEQEKTQVAKAASTAEDTEKAIKSISAKESAISKDVKSVATKHSTAVSQWKKDKEAVVSQNKELDAEYKKALESYQEFVKSVDSESASVLAQYKDAIIEVSKEVQNTPQGVKGYQEYLLNLAKLKQVNKESVKSYLVKKAEYEKVVTNNSLTVEKNNSNSARIEAENKAKSLSAESRNTELSLSAQAVVNSDKAKSLSVSQENLRLSTSASEENAKRSLSAKNVEDSNNAKSASAEAENIRRSNSAKAENDRLSNSVKEVETGNIAKSNSVVKENNDRSLSAQKENERLSNSAKQVEDNNIVKSNSVKDENDKRSLSAQKENERLSNSAKGIDEENKAKSQSADAENTKRSLSAKAENEKRSNAVKAVENNNVTLSNSVVKENERLSLSAQAETNKRSLSAEQENTKRSLSAKAENEKRSNAATVNPADKARSQSVDAENAKRSNSAKAENERRSNSAKAVENDNIAKSNSVIAKNKELSLSAKAETDRRSNSAKAENEKRSLAAKQQASGNAAEKNTAIKAYNRAVMEAAGLTYTGDMTKDKKTVDDYNAKLEAERQSLPPKNAEDAIYSTQPTSYFSGEDPRKVNLYSKGWEWVRGVRTSYQGVSTAEGVTGVSLRWKRGVTKVTDLKGGSIYSFDEALRKNIIHNDTFLEPPVYATVFSGEEKTTKSGTAYREMTYRLVDAGEMKNGQPLDVLVTARVYTPKGRDVTPYNTLGYSNTNALDFNYSGGAAYELYLKPVIKGTDISVNAAYTGIVSDVDYSQGSHISTENGSTTLNPVGSDLSVDSNQHVYTAPPGGVSDLADAPQGAYLYTMSGETVHYVHSSGWNEITPGDILNGNATPAYNNMQNSLKTYVEFTLFGDWLSIPTTLKSKVVLKPLVSEASPKYVEVTYQPATYTPVTFTPKDTKWTPVTYEKVPFTPTKPTPYTPVSYEKVTYEKATYKPVEYKPQTPPKYEPVSYEKVTYTPKNAEWKPVGYEKVTYTPEDTSWKPVTYEKVTYTPENASYKPVSFEKVTYTPEDSSWKPVDYKEVGFKPQNSDWTPVPYTPAPFTPEKLQELPKVPTLTLVKPNEPKEPEFKRIPEQPKAPTTKYHLTSLVINTPAEKLVQNEDGVDVDNQSVAKNSTNHFILKPKSLPSGRPLTRSIVLSDYMADGLEIDVEGTKKANATWDVTFETSSRLLQALGNDKELAIANKDLAKDYTPTPFTIIYKTLNDGATYENVFRMDVNGGVTGNVDVEYRVEGSNILLGRTKDTVNEPVGSSYDTTDQIRETFTKDGITYKRVPNHIEGKEKGEVEEGTKLVIYFYKPVDKIPNVGDVIVHYVDEEGNTIRNDHEDVKGGKVGDPYDTTDNKPKEIKFGGKVYQLVPNKTVGNENGKVIDGITEVTYVYKQITPDKPKGDGYTAYSNKVRIHTPGSPTNPNNPDNPNGGGNHKIQPVKNNTNKQGKNINGKTLLQTDINYYVAEWDLDQYINDKSPKSAIAKGFGYLENYPEHALTPITKEYYAVTSKGDKVEGLDFYEVDSNKLGELPESVQQFLKGSGLDLSKFGKFHLWVAKDSQEFYDKYVKTGQDIFFHMPMSVNKGFTGKYENQTFQIDFGNGYFGNVVENNVPNVTPKKDVVVDGTSVDNKTIAYGQEFDYLLQGAKLPSNRGSQLWEVQFSDDYDEKGDKYLGYKTVASTNITVTTLEEVKEDIKAIEEVTLEDGKVVKVGEIIRKGSKIRRTHTYKVGEDLTKFTKVSHDEKLGLVTVSFLEEFLRTVDEGSEFGADVKLHMKRIAHGDFENTYVNRINGVDYISNTVRTNTPKPKDPETPNTPDKPNKPQEPQLPNTGTEESLMTFAGIFLASLGAASLKRKED